ncbi:MAG TPA: hypothetical protein VD999_01345 [Vitreimonas sp.]|nr:hypothetical protein [Vitreimonas sp.]
MNDFSAPSSSTTPQTTSPSYVDDYMPPTSAAAPVQPTTATPGHSPAPIDMAPPTDMAQPATPNGDAPRPTISQALEDQNIFHLLGVMDGSDEDKEAFLDELQQVIWEDFLEKDVELLVTEEELDELKKMMLKKDVTEVQRQEEMITYLSKLIPDLEEIMLEKALELKEDMVRERINGMRQYFAGNPGALGQLDQAEQLINDDQWRDAAEVLNAIK